MLARCNLFLTLVENFRYLFGAERIEMGCMPMFLDCIADTISWNIWQMDGLKKTVPGIPVCAVETAADVENLPGTDIPCKIKDWKADKEILFKDVGENEQ